MRKNWELGVPGSQVASGPRPQAEGTLRHVTWVARTGSLTPAPTVECSISELHCPHGLGLEVRPVGPGQVQVIRPAPGRNLGTTSFGESHKQTRNPRPRPRRPGPPGRSFSESGRIRKRGLPFRFKVPGSRNQGKSESESCGAGARGRRPGANSVSGSSFECLRGAPHGARWQRAPRLVLSRAKS